MTRRILYFYSSHQFDTGSPKALAGLIDALDRQRWTPVYLACGEGPLVDEMRRRDVPVLRGEAGAVTWRRPFEAARRVWGAARLLRQNRIDLLHVNEFGWNLDLVLGAALARVPVVLHVHNPLVVPWGNLNRLAASRVVFVSHGQLECTVHLERIRAKSTVLYNPVNLERFASGRNIRRTLGVGDDATVVSTVSQITPRKGVHDLLETARILLPRWERLHFLVIGPAGRGHDSYAREMRAAASAPPFAGRVHFLGSRQDIPDLLASSDIFFLPTHAETFGIAVVEAMAAGLPVVSSRVVGVSEIVRSGEEGLLLPPEEPDGYAAALESLIADRTGRLAIGQKGRSGLVGRFDLDTFRRALDALYAGLHVHWRH